MINLMQHPMKDWEDEDLKCFVARQGGYMRMLEQILRAMDGNKTQASKRLELLKGVLEQAVEYMDAIQEDREPRVQTKDIDELSTVVSTLQLIRGCVNCEFCRNAAIITLRMIGKE